MSSTTKAKRQKLSEMVKDIGGRITHQLAFHIRIHLQTTNHIHDRNNPLHPVTEEPTNEENVSGH